MHAILLHLHKFLCCVAADEDFRPVLQLVTLPVGSSSGFTRCISVSIIDDTEPETNEEFTLTLFASDVAVAIAPDGATTTIVIQDNEGSYEPIH